MVWLKEQYPLDSGSLFGKGVGEWEKFDTVVVVMVRFAEEKGMTTGVVDLQSKWEEVFRSTPWAKYPSEEMIRFIARTFSKNPDRQSLRFLDLGCGIGTCSWYISREGYTVQGIDCSETAVDFAQKWFANENLKGSFQVGMMETLPFGDAQFDCVVDNVSSGSAPLPTIQTILSEVCRVLKPGGYYWGMFLGSECTIEGKQNPNSDDPDFYETITAGPIRNAATVRLITEQEALVLGQGFASVTVDYCVRTVANRSEKVQHWVVIGQKKG